MPGRDGTGPFGAGTGSGTAANAGQGRGRGSGTGAGRGMGRGFGPAEECVCPQCGTKIAHTRGVPCFQQKCPSCGASMTRG